MEHEQLGRLGHSETESGETDGRVLTTTKNKEQDSSRTKQSVGKSGGG